MLVNSMEEAARLRRQPLAPARHAMESIVVVDGCPGLEPVNLNALLERFMNVAPLTALELLELDFLTPFECEVMHLELLAPYGAGRRAVPSAKFQVVPT